MDKVTAFLERYVQWVALAIAALFLIYAGMSYLPVVSQPIAVSLPGSSEPLAPGDVDRKIDTDVVEPLLGRVDKPVTPAPIAVPKYGTEVRQRLNQPSTLPTLPAALVDARPVELPNIDWNVNLQQSTGSTKVAKLPVMPAAVIDTLSTGFAQVYPANASGTTPGAATPAPTPTAAAGAAAGAAGAAGAAAGAPGATATPTEDRTWVRVPYTIPVQQILSAFRGVNIPPEWNKTTILRVELVRQRQLGIDKWGPDEVVAPLPTVTLRPMPPEGAGNQPAQAEYLTWAQANQLPIIQPPFFTVVAGDDPNMTRPEPIAAVDRPFNPADYAEGPIPANLTPEQKREIAKYREEQRRANRPAPRPRTPTGGGRGAGAGGGVLPEMPWEPTPTIIPADRFQNRPPPPPRRPGGGIDPGMPAGGGAPDMPGYPGAAGPGAIPPQMTPGQPIVLTPVPAAPFTPSPEMPDIQGVAYDITATPDVTYRYRLRYAAQNPVFGSQNVAADQSLAQVFALVGENKDVWSEPITIAPLTHIFLAQLAAPGSNSAKFTVFRWQAGKQQMTTVNAQAGDSIGKVENGVDFRTNWTLVEVRRDTSSPQVYAVVMNADGTLRRHTFEGDTADPLQAKLRAEVEAGANPNGVPPPPPGPGQPGRPPVARPPGGAAGEGALP